MTIEEQVEVDEYQLGSIYDSIETNLWQSDGYYASGAIQLGNECLESAWQECIRFESDFLGTEYDRQFRGLVAQVGIAMTKHGLELTI